MKTKRKNYFIDRTFQTEFIVKFCGLVAVGCLTFGAVVYIFSKKTLTTSFENSRLVVKSTADYLLPGLLSGGLIVAFLTAFITAIVVLFMTHKLAGPMYRLERYAQKVGSGELSSDLKIRKNDQFQNLAGAFNKMIDGLKMGLLKVIGVSERLDTLIEQLSDSSNNKVVLKDDIKRIVSELKANKQDLKKALAYFRVK